MTLNKALDLFEITDISVESESELKLKFKKLTKKYHPDNIKTGDHDKFLDIHDAFEMLKDAIIKLNQYKQLNTNKQLITMVIPLDKLVYLYEGNKFTMGSGDNTIEVDKKTMSKNNSLILSKVNIIHNGLEKEFTNIERWDISDRYKVYCTVDVTDINSKESVTVKIMDKIKEFDMEYQSITLRFTLQFNIVVDVILNKKIVVESET